MDGEAGFEPAFPEPKSRVLPLDDSPMVARTGFEPVFATSEAVFLPIRRPGITENPLHFGGY